MKISTAAAVAGATERACISRRGISVRFEAIDALETRFQDTHQELAGGNDARDAMLAHLGFTNVKLFPNEPNEVESPHQVSLRVASSRTGSTPTAG